VGPHFSETIVPRIELKFTFCTSLKRTDGNEVNALPPRDASGLPRLGQARARTQTQQTHFCCQGNWPKPFVSNPTFRIVLPCLCFFQLTAPCRESSGISSVHHFFEGYSNYRPSRVGGYPILLPLASNIPLNAPVCDLHQSCPSRIPDFRPRFLDRCFIIVETTM